jgi:hypothetical protein
MTKIGGRGAGGMRSGLPADDPVVQTATGLILAHLFPHEKLTTLVD